MSAAPTPSYSWSFAQLNDTLNVVALHLVGALGPSEVCSVGRLAQVERASRKRIYGDAPEKGPQVVGFFQSKPFRDRLIEAVAMAEAVNAYDEVLRLCEMGLAIEANYTPQTDLDEQHIAKLKNLRTQMAMEAVKICGLMNGTNEQYNVDQMYTALFGELPTDHIFRRQIKLLLVREKGAGPKHTTPLQQKVISILDNKYGSN